MGYFSIFLCATIILHQYSVTALPADEPGVDDIFPIEEAPASFPESPSPLENDQQRHNPEFQDFIRELYRFDKSKKTEVDELVRARRTIHPFTGAMPQHATRIAIPTDLSDTSLTIRGRRAVIFRPLFVYRQQQVRKERVNVKPAAPVAPVAPVKLAPKRSQQKPVPQRQQPAANSNLLYPYQYGQRYPYTG